MKNDFFKPNYRAIYKAIDEGNSAEAWKELRAIEKKIRDRVNARFAKKQREEAEAKLKAVKDLPTGAIVWYIGKGTPLFGLSGIKVKDGRTRMQVDFGGGIGTYTCYYANLSAEAPTENQKFNNKMAHIVSRVFGQ